MPLFAADARAAQLPERADERRVVLAAGGRRETGWARARGKDFVRRDAATWCRDARPPSETSASPISEAGAEKGSVADVTRAEGASPAL